MASEKKDVVRFDWKFLKMRLIDRLMSGVLIPTKKEPLQ